MEMEFLFSNVYWYKLVSKLVNLDIWDFGLP
jgi:hypothetical protein